MAHTGTSKLVECPLCGKQVRARGYISHLRISHPGTDSQGVAAKLTEVATDNSKQAVASKAELSLLQERLSQLSQLEDRLELMETQTEWLVGEQDATNGQVNKVTDLVNKVGETADKNRAELNKVNTELHNLRSDLKATYNRLAEVVNDNADKVKEALMSLLEDLDTLYKALDAHGHSNKSGVTAPAQLSDAINKYIAKAEKRKKQSDSKRDLARLFKPDITDLF